MPQTTTPDTHRASPAPSPAVSLHAARPGTWTDMHGQTVEVTPALLAALAASYDPAVYRAPLVVGHPQANSPAFGWITRARAEPDGLWLDAAQVDAAYLAAVREERYPHRSLSFWPVGHPGSPVPGQPYIRHLGALGGVPPAIPGLRGADLAGPDADGVVTLTVDLAAEPGADPAADVAAPRHPASIISHPSPRSPMPDPSPDTVDLAARTAAVEERERAAAAQAAALEATRAELDRRAAALTAQAEAATRAEVLAFAETLADQARIRPADVPAFCEILLRLADGASKPAVAFAASGSSEPAPAADWLRGWLATQPPLVELAEVATHQRAGGTTPPDDAAIVTRARELHRAASAAGHPISFSAAVQRAEAEAK